MPFIRPIEVDLNGGEAAASGGILCSSNEGDANAELIGDHGNDEVGDHPSSDEVGDHGNDEVGDHPKDVMGGSDNIGEARKLRIPNVPGRATRREVEEHVPCY